MVPELATNRTSASDFPGIMRFANCEAHLPRNTIIRVMREPKSMNAGGKFIPPHWPCDNRYAYVKHWDEIAGVHYPEIGWSLSDEFRGRPITRIPANIFDVMYGSEEFSVQSWIIKDTF
jgi:hypothetical protein